MKTKEIVAVIVLLIVGSIYTFVPPQMIVRWGIVFLRHNDRVLVGILCLTAGIILVFRLMRKKSR